MIRNKKALVTSIILLGICMCLFFPFPNYQMLNARISFMSFPILKDDGYVLLGILGSVLFILAVILLVKGIKKFHLLSIGVVLITFTFFPLLLITIYQETFASGIMAISYTENGECQFDVVSQHILQGECYLELQNRSNEAVSFELEFLDDHLTEKGQRMESLMNVAGPYFMTIEPNRKKSIHIKEFLDVSEVPNHFIQGGGSSYIHVKIIDGKTARIL
ncbi:hypothetical protein J2D69_09685 [Lysinibacillus sphaericus]|uniref:Uncharacterized protein n=3 Tax=Lysinibacillus TaxID=400634 RepID=B1HWY3_LYSSC|nr:MULTISPECIES: hypothetical protein [Lysinibacillus]MBE5082407.1 hypothetical protein [Bacillus thuringiensis]ACA39968.1 conserved hypothetical protein [Lysinibacillus sphaericus C3-41]AMO33936.1 hypothetical protein AR327_16625 [Lysinibacillus sphaericus]AMR90955.1 hypothetical protein A1T07_12585 [Lysinibacillus sphaericus]ANA45005.1 hypothetical protein A2J09_05255 [Lysinibacillus sphaericus]